MRYALLLSLTLVLAPLSASDTLDLANGRSPDGNYSVRVRAPMDPGDIAILEVVQASTTAVVGTTDTGGYSGYPSVADDTSTAVLWSPDSKHLAVMTRGTKRSTELRLFHVTASGLTEIKLPSPTDRAFQLLNATSVYRTVFQRPMKWIDSNSLVVLASGGVQNTTGDKYPTGYEVEITYDIRKQIITNAKVLTKRSYHG